MEGAASVCRNGHWTWPRHFGGTWQLLRHWSQLQLHVRLVQGQSDVIGGENKIQLRPARTVKLGNQGTSVRVQSFAPCQTSTYVHESRVLEPIGQHQHGQTESAPF